MSGQKALAQAATRQGSRVSSPATVKSAAVAQRVGNRNLALLLQLDELARDPRQAHLEWHRLDVAQKISVAERMRRRFGARFTRRFLIAARLGKATPEVRYYPRGSGPSPRELRAQGFVRAGEEITGIADVDIDWWFSPTGILVRRTRAAMEVAIESEEEEKDKGETPNVEVQSPQENLQVIDLRGYTPVQLLRIAEKGLDDLHAYCKEDWFEGTTADLEETAEFAKEVKTQQFKVDSALATLKSALTKPDARPVTPTFRKRVTEAEQRNETLRKLCCQNVGWRFGCVSEPAPDLSPSPQTP